MATPKPKPRPVRGPTREQVAAFIVASNEYDFLAHFENVGAVTATPRSRDVEAVSPRDVECGEVGRDA